MTVLIDAGTVAVTAALFAAAYGVACSRPGRIGPAPAPATPRSRRRTPGPGQPVGQPLAADRGRRAGHASGPGGTPDHRTGQPANDPYHTTIHLRDDVDGEVLPALTHPAADAVQIARSSSHAPAHRWAGFGASAPAPVTPPTFTNDLYAKRSNHLPALAAKVAEPGALMCK
jgi:hypothetical protein